MTDWLEELLEQVQEEERPEGFLDWPAEIPTVGLSQTQQSGGEPNSEEQTAGERTQPWEGEDRPSSRDRRLGTEELLPAETAEQAIEAVWRRREQIAAGQEQPSSGGSAVMEEAGVVRTETENQAADGLYRQLVRAGRAAEAVRPARQTTVVEQMSTGAPSLTVDELDRAVRRDSRRYDGGMELY